MTSNAILTAIVLAHSSPLFYTLMIAIFILPICLALWSLVDAWIRGSRSDLVRATLALIAASALVIAKVLGYL